TGYCAADGGSTQYEWIDLIAISGTSINNTTGSNSGYGDFTSQVGNVVTGSTYTISMSAGFSGSTYSENWLFYADWNRDGDFADAGEELGGGTTTNGNTYTTDFTVPSGASLGDTRFRAVMRWNTAAVECGNSSYGEVEDYTLNVCDANTTQVLYEEVHGEALEITQINDRLQLYPNPTTEILNVQIERMPADAVISISDMLGRRVESLTMSEAQNGINVSGLQSGMYIIRIQGTEESFSQSFRKE
ncbi:MAG TPA: peptidase S8, partial [Cytophagales bacterium]|nr:peptidase S8 [Cytophagales bacterium]